MSYVIEPSEVSPGENPVATMTNIGLRMIYAGRSYGLERLTDSEWERVRSGCIFTLDAIVMKPSGSWSQAIRACDRHGYDKVLSPGFYRVTTDVTVVGGQGTTDDDEELVVRATFRVVSETDS